jgi:peptidyl-prolyl cis-trans isomerase A (cyclophilin A)
MGMTHLVRAAILLSSALLLAAGPPPRKAAQARPAAVQPLPARVLVSMQTSEGSILLELDAEHAPLSVANFLKYVAVRRFDGTEIYRAMKYGAQEEARAGLIQGRARWDGRAIIPPVKHEPTTQTGLKHLDGTISFARGAVDTATSDFFITLGPMPALDADPQAAGDNLGYAAFGRVVEGMDVVRKIHALPISAAAGEGIMKGQILDKPVRIITTRRLPSPAAKPAPPAAQ